MKQKKYFGTDGIRGRSNSWRFGDLEGRLRPIAAEGYSTGYTMRPALIVYATRERLVTSLTAVPVVPASCEQPPLSRDSTADLCCGPADRGQRRGKARLENQPCRMGSGAQPRGHGAAQRAAKYNDPVLRYSTIPDQVPLP